LIAIASGLIAARYLRTPHGRRIGAIALIFCLTGISGAVLSAAKLAIDGSGRIWTGVSVLASDPEGDALTYSLTVAPADMNIDSDGLITWTLPTLGTHNITVTVSDGQTQAEQSYTLTISAAPIPEIILASPTNGSTYQVGSTISLAANTNMAPTDVKTIGFFAGADIVAVGVLSAGQYTATWAAPTGNHSVFVRLTDNADNTYDSGSVSITVSASCVPEVSLTSPANGTTVTALGELVLTAQGLLFVPKSIKPHPIPTFPRTRGKGIRKRERDVFSPLSPRLCVRIILCTLCVLCC